MNMSRLKRIFVGLIIGLVLAAGLSAAPSATGSITLSGTQGNILSIPAVTGGAATTLALTTAVSNLVIGTVTELSNDTAGYKVTISSANALAKLSNTASLTSTTTPDFLPYTIEYGGTAVTFASGVGPVITSASTKTPLAGIVRNITVSFDGTAANLSSGFYSDTLTFTIIAN